MEGRRKRVGGREGERETERGRSREISGREIKEREQERER